MKIINLGKLQDKLKVDMGSEVVFPENSRLRNEESKDIWTIEEDDEFEKMVIEDTVKGIIDMYGYTRDIAEKLVTESELKWSIKVAPDVIAHCSKEQLVDLIID